MQHLQLVDIFLEHSIANYTIWVVTITFLNLCKFNIDYVEPTTAKIAIPASANNVGSKKNHAATTSQTSWVAGVCVAIFAAMHF